MCNVPDCQKPVHAKGLCPTHYHGQPHMIARRTARARANPRQTTANFARYKRRHPARRAASVAKYDRANQARRNAAEAARRAARSCTPQWLLDTEREAIVVFYQNCPKGLQVDHVIPLKGGNVTGWHCLANLQYLSAPENASKGNKLIPAALGG